MNIFSQGKYCFTTMLLAVVTSTAALSAAHEAPAAKHAKKHGKKKSPQNRGNNQFTALSLNLETLKELGPQFQGPKNVPLSKMIGEVIDNAQTVVNNGPHTNPMEVNKTLITVKKLLGYLKTKKAYHKDHFTSSSSEIGFGCDVCSDLSELESEVAKCCKSIKGQIYTLLRFLKAEFPCNAPIAIDHVPYTITESGKYCVTRDLVYSGTGAAITVNANNVTINFHSHSLTLNNSAAVGVLAQNVSEFTLENDIIKGAAMYKTATSAAVQLTSVQKAKLTNIYTFNTTKGVKIENSTDVLIENSLLSTHEGLTVPNTASIGAGIWVDASTHVVVDGCTLQGAVLSSPLATGEASNAILVQGASEDIVIKNSTFKNWLSTITLNQVTGALIENCQADASPLSKSNLLELGSMTSKANDVTIRNATFRQETSVPGFDGLLFLNGSGCLMENVVVDVKTENDGVENNAYYPGAMHVGCAVNGHVSCDPLLAYSDILAKSCIIKGANEYGLLVENGANIQFINSQFTDASLANIWLDGAVDVNHDSLWGAQGCVIKDSTITSAIGSGNGVVINAGAGTNAFVDCDISHNSENGIVIAEHAKNNHLTGNSVFGNAGNGIEDNEASTATFYNISCNNGGQNCINVFPAQSPGNTAFAGSNICCNLPQ